jgi:UDP-glucuronate 4-epimerase
MRILVTGTAGFIGFHLARRLLVEGHEVVGIDALTDYYDVGLKRARRELLLAYPAFRDHEFRLENSEAVFAAAEAAAPQAIVHLAAQAGVRYSLREPRAYLDSNMVGTFNVMEAARRLSVGHLLFASSSSVYGADETIPFRESSAADRPLTFYAATKKSGEDMTHAYSHLWNLPTTVARFFTVYGPWGRPDMALSLFVEAILKDEAISLHGYGEMERDFTYVDDLVEGLLRLLGKPPERGRPIAGGSDSLSPVAPWRVVNIGRGEPVRLSDFVAAIERTLGRTAIRKLEPIQPGESRVTFASADLLEALTGFRPHTPLAAGVAAFCEWYIAYHAAHKTPSW